MNRVRRPFWLPASNYYVLAVAISTAFFFLVWGILHDGGEELPWITAGISASILLCGAVILREIVLRRARNRYLRQQRMLENMMYRGGVERHGRDPRNSSKLTLEGNAAILNEIQLKSEAARVLNRVSAGHQEVFELCSEYILRNDDELKTVGAGSPRLAPLLKGRSAAAEYHKYHLLKWAEMESRNLTNEARSLSNPAEKVEAAQNALSVIESALDSYPAEPALLQSQELLRDLIVSIKLAPLVEKAERAVFEGDYAGGKSLYRDALFYLGRDNIESESRRQAADRINGQIERIRTLENDK